MRVGELDPTFEELEVHGGASPYIGTCPCLRQGPCGWWRFGGRLVLLSRWMASSRDVDVDVERSRLGVLMIQVESVRGLGIEGGAKEEVYMTE
jgi:hypothetical protein